MVPVQTVTVDCSGAGLDRANDPALLVAYGDKSRAQTRGFNGLKNLLADGSSLRSLYGRQTVLGNTIYLGGTADTLAIYARTDATRYPGSLLVAVRQDRFTSEASATASGYLVDTNNYPFRPEHVGHLVYRTASGAYTTITAFLTVSKVAVADDIFSSGDSYWIATGGQVVALGEYVVDGMLSLTNNAVLGEMNDDEYVQIFSFQNRAYILTGADRGAIVYKNSFRKLGLRECRDNNSLSVDVTAYGALTGNYKWALCWYDADTFKISGPYVIDNSGDFYALTAKRMLLDATTLPTNTTDTWTHYQLYRRRDEWADWYLVGEILKTAAAGSGTTTSAAVNKLYDTGAAFTEADVGMSAVCTASGKAALITDLVSANELTLDGDVFLGGGAWVLADGNTTSAEVNKLVDSTASFDASYVGLSVHNDSLQWVSVIGQDPVNPTTKLLLDGDIFPGTNPYWFGSHTTGASANKLIDSTASFDTTYLGKRVHDTANPPNWATINSIDSATQVGLSADIFGSGEGWSIETGRITSTANTKMIDARASFDAGYIGLYVMAEDGSNEIITGVDSTIQLQLASDIFSWTGEAYTTEFSDDKTDALALASNVLIPDRDPPAGYRRMFVYRNRPHFYGGYRLKMAGAVSATNGSATVTVASPYSTDEWMIGKEIYIAAAGGTSPDRYVIRQVLSSTQLELETEFGGTTVASGDAIVVSNANRIAFAFGTFSDCEMQHVYYTVDVRAHDGDEIIYCAVVNDRPVVLKRRGAFLLLMPDVIDPVDSSIPDVYYRVVDMECTHGCVGPRAATQDRTGRLFWFAGATGIMMYDGSRIANLSGPVRDWFLELDSDLFYDAVMFYQPNSEEIVLANLSLADGTQENMAIAVSLRDGRWREMADLDIAAASLVRVKT